MKKYISFLLVIVLCVSIFPSIVLASEYISLKELAEINGYEYFEFSEKDTVNVRSSSYILSFQTGNKMLGYKTVLGDVGTITLNDVVKKENDAFYISKLDAQTKLIKYFPNLQSNVMSYNESDFLQAESDNSPSDWAIDEINEAINNDLVTSNARKDYKADISREYFCELVVKLYEKISGKAATFDYNPFSDTDNNDVIKAYKLGIVNGVSDTEFAPYEYITRQEICAMLVRTIGVVYSDIDLNDYEYHTFFDSEYISGWAMDSVQFAYDNNIIQGIGDNKLEPLGNTTCEQAILLINRIYKNKEIFEKRDKDSQKVIEPLKTLNFDDDSEVKSVTVSFEDGSDASRVKIREINSSDLIYQTTGMKGAGVNITSSDNFDKATITFEYNAEQLNGSNPSDLAIAWYNTDLNRIEVLESQVNTSDHTVSVETTHFSQYILVDSKEWYSVWQRGQTIIREMDNDGNYAENFNVQLVVDCSGSMSGERIAAAKECIYDFIERLSDNDRLSLIQFENSAKTLISSTLVKDIDMDSVKNVVMSMSDGGGTDFNAALNECINTLDFNENYNNIIVFLSDGGSSVNYSLLQTLKENNVRIASVALGSGCDTNRMKQLSDSTNGQYVYAEDSSALDVIYDAIQGSLIGVDAIDSDGDNIPDMIEITGMKNQYGKIIRTDPSKADTDGDGKSDAEEMGKLIESDDLTIMDKKNGITSNVYFEMISNPLDGTDENSIPECIITEQAVSLGDMDSNGYFNCNFKFKCIGEAKNLTVHFDTDDCIVWDMAQHLVDFQITDFNGDILKHTLKSGMYNVNLTMQCFNKELNMDCYNNHRVKVVISGDNFNTVEEEATLSTNSDNDINVSKPEKKYQYTKEELENEDNSFEIDGDCYCYDEDVEINCDLKFKYNSKLTCAGDVTIGNKGILDMSQGGILSVNGDFKFDSGENHLGKLNLGTIEIHGNAEFVRNFYANQSNKVVFKGYGVHEINMWNKFWNDDQYFQDIEVEGNIFQIRLKEKNTIVNGKITFYDWSWLNQLFFGDELQMADTELTPIEEQLLKISVMRAYVQYGERVNMIGDIDYLNLNEENIEYTYAIQDPNNKRKIQYQTIKLTNVNANGMDIGKNLVFIEATYKGKLYVFSTSPDFAEEVYKYFKKEITKGVILDIANNFVDEYKSLVLGCISDFLPSDINDTYQMLKFLVEYEKMLETYDELSK